MFGFDDLMENGETVISEDLQNESIGSGLVQEGDWNVNRETYLGSQQPSSVLQDNFFMASLPAFDVNPEFIIWDPSDVIKDISCITNVEGNTNLSSATVLKDIESQEDCRRLLHRLGLSNTGDPVLEPDTSDNEDIIQSHSSKAPRQRPGELVLVLSPIKRFHSYQSSSHW